MGKYKGVWVACVGALMSAGLAAQPLRPDAGAGVPVPTDAAQRRADLRAALHAQLPPPQTPPSVASAAQPALNPGQRAVLRQQLREQGQWLVRP